MNIKYNLLCLTLGLLESGCVYESDHRRREEMAIYQRQQEEKRELEQNNANIEAQKQSADDEAKNQELLMEIKAVNAKLQEDIDRQNRAVSMISAGSVEKGISKKDVIDSLGNP